MFTNRFKEGYCAALHPKPVWPMQMHRINAIYGTMARAIRKASDGDKESLKRQLLASAHDFGASCRQITKCQPEFDEWFGRQAEALQHVPFRWHDRRDDERSHITFGLTQKFLNLALKDWWCMSAEAEELDTSVLHAPFDRRMRDRLWALTRFYLPSLRQGGCYVYLSCDDYAGYQQHLLSAELRDVLKITQAMTRIETEQMIWGS